MPISMGKFTVLIHKKGNPPLKCVYCVEGEAGDFGTGTAVEGPAVTTTTPAGHVTFTTTIKRKCLGIDADVLMTEEVAGTTGNFDPPSIKGPVMVVVDPPKCKKPKNPPKRALPPTKKPIFGIEEDLKIDKAA